MKITELVKSIYMTNEEKDLLETFDSPQMLKVFPEREQTIINNLIRKSIISKVQHNGTIMVIRNDL
jgi:transcriptional regulator